MGLPMKKWVVIAIVTTADNLNDKRSNNQFITFMNEQNKVFCNLIPFSMKFILTVSFFYFGTKFWPVSRSNLWNGIHELNLIK